MHSLVYIHVILSLVNTFRSIANVAFICLQPPIQQVPAQPVQAAAPQVVQVDGNLRHPPAQPQPQANPQPPPQPAAAPPQPQNNLNGNGAADNETLSDIGQYSKAFLLFFVNCE